MRATHEERAEIAENFGTRLVPAICAALRQKDPGSAWEIDSKPERTDREVIYLRNGDAAIGPERIVLRLDAWDGRIRADGLYGTNLGGGLWSPRDSARYLQHLPADPNPTMSMTKPAAQLAAEIARRLLPDYRTLLTVYREQYRGQVEHRDGTRELAKELIASASQVLRPWGQAWQATDQRTLSATVQGLQGIRGDIEVNSADSVSVKLNLDPAAARRLVWWINEQPMENEADAE